MRGEDPAFVQSGVEEIRREQECPVEIARRLRQSERDHAGEGLVDGQRPAEPAQPPDLRRCEGPAPDRDLVQREGWRRSRAVLPEADEPGRRCRSGRSGSLADRVPVDVETDPLVGRSRP